MMGFLAIWETLCLDFYEGVSNTETLWRVMA
jgi:hypothetical protein